MAATAATNAPQISDSQATESRKRTNNMLRMLVNTASTTTAEPVAHGVVAH